jgi:ethanolamine transporter EutH
VIAMILGVILAGVIALAVRSYLKNKAEKQSED